MCSFVLFLSLSIYIYIVWHACRPLECLTPFSSVSCALEKHNRGAPRKCFKDQLKKQLSLAGIDHCTQGTADRDSWHQSTRKVGDYQHRDGMKESCGGKTQTPQGISILSGPSQTKSLPAQNAEGSADHELDFTATNTHVKIDLPSICACEELAIIISICGQEL